MSVCIQKGNCLRKKALILLFLIFGSTALPIDNPDSPDYVTEFLKRAETIENNISKKTAPREIKEAQSEYESFLDKELNLAFSQIKKKLSGNSKDNLISAQKKWLKFRESENTFINLEWTTEKFGTSANTTKNASTALLTKNRIVELLYYLKNF
jgi:uncharacterized protein YecT (DUF1311 family)